MFNAIPSNTDEIDNPIKVSVVIVSYNCLDFLRLCLNSLLWKNHNNMELIVVDNNSSDGTVSVLKDEFPELRLIANDYNAGFGKACNQGIKIAGGHYLLMLNPDTFVPEDLTSKIISFMDKHERCGAMGAYMMDAKGKFLPESKRGMPTPFRSFCRFSGLSALFPSSAYFAGYYAGNIPKDKVAEVEILSGAFMVLRRDALAETGGFDEDFFMYGEDIDLSWRIHKAGWLTYYNPDIRIVHFKGESGDKDPAYVKVFYEAMQIFYRKHFGQHQNKFARFFIKSVIHLMTVLSSLKSKLSRRKGRDEEYPVSEDSYIFSEDYVAAEHAGKLLFSGKLLPWSDLEPQRLNEPLRNCILDISSCLPSKILDFVRIKGFFCKRLFWLAKGRRCVFLPLNSSVRTRITTLD